MASVWLLRGAAGARIIRDCDGAATGAICSLPATILRPKGAEIAAIALVGPDAQPARGSPESDRGPRPEAAETKTKKRQGGEYARCPDGWLSTGAGSAGHAGELAQGAVQRLGVSQR